MEEKGVAAIRRMTKKVDSVTNFFSMVLMLL